MKFEKAKRVIKTMAAAGMALSLGACGIVDEGTFAVEKHIGGSYNPQPVLPGMHPFDNVLDSFIKVTDKEVMIQLEDLKPKDKDGVLLKDLDLTIIIKVNKDKAVPFLMKTGDLVPMSQVKGMEGTEYSHYVIGYKSVGKEAASSIQKAMRGFSGETALDQQDKLEEAIKTQLQKDLDDIYKDVGAPIQVVGVKTYSIKVSDAVEQKIQAVAAVKVENERQAAERAVLESRKETEAKEMANLKEVALKSGISVDQILMHRMIKTIAESGNAQTAVKVNLDMPGKAPGP